VSSKEVKEKKAKPRLDSKSEIQMKDESLKATPRTSNIIEQTSHRSTSTPSLRKTPGSGFRMGKSTPQDSPSHTATIEPSNHVLPRSKPADARAIRNKEPALSTAKPLHRHSHSTNPERKVVSATQPQRIKKIREDAGGGTDSEREKHADHARVLRKEKARTREHGAIESSHPQDEDPSALKRKKTIHNNADYDASSSRSASQKKRKLEDGIGLAFTSAGEDPRAKDLSLPKKPEFTAAARPRVRKELSPLPQQTSLPRIKRDSTRTSLPTHESTPPPTTIKRDDSRAAHKTRRRSPIYTSSEDERSFHSPRRAISIGPLPTPPMTTHHASPAVPPAHSHPRNHSQARDTLPLPTKHAELRARYSATYLEYLSIFRKLVAQKGKIDSMLKSNDIVSAGSITDSDGDVELMDPDELARISSEYKLLEEELERIRHTFSRFEGDC
jgi:RNA polymerase II elongation factor ELL